MWGTWGTLPTLSTRMGRGACWSSRMELGRVTSYSLIQICIKPTNKLVSSYYGAPLVLRQAMGTLDSLDSPRPELRGSHHLPPYSILCASPRHPHPNGFLFRDSQGGVPKLSRFGLPGLWTIITLCLNLWLQWSLEKTCSFPRDLSNSVSHFTCTHRGRVDSRLLVVASLTSDLLFCHNLCCRCPNGPCKAIFDIYTSIAFQWYKEHPNAMCFDPCNRILKLWESRRTPKSQIRECEFHPHTPSK